MFAEKYKPESLEDIVGQQEAVSEIMKWFEKWKPGDKAMLIHGPTGVGKTLIIQSIAAQKNMDFIEMNASDYRSAKKIREQIGSSVVQRSLFKRGKVFMIDEVDALSGVADRGGISELIKLIGETKYPIIITANKPYISKLSKLRKHCRMVELVKLSVQDIENHLNKIIKKENINIERDALKQLAKLAEGDLRAAMNDLESLCGRKKKITVDDVDTLSKREREQTVYDALNKVFKADTVMDARRAIDGADKPIDEIFWWIETNITNEFQKAEEIADAFDALSIADIFRQRIRKTHNWRFLAYVVDMMTGGVAVAKREKYNKFVRYQYPTMIATLGRTRRMRAERDAMLMEFSQQLHCSKRKVNTEFLPYINIISK